MYGCTSENVLFLGGGLVFQKYFELQILELLYFLVRYLSCNIYSGGKILFSLNHSAGFSEPKGYNGHQWENN